MTSATPSPDKVYALATAELGYTEGSNNSNKYAAMIGVANNEAWCTTFASAMFKNAGFASLIKVGNYSVDQYNWFKSKNRASGYPAVGSLVWFGPGGENHTGIVFGYDADYIYTIEGNYGNKVATHKRKRRANSDGSYEDPSIGAPYAYGYPNYAEGIETADPNHTVAGSKYVAIASATLPGSDTTTTPPVTDPPVTTTPPVTTPSGPTQADLNAAVTTVGNAYNVLGTAVHNALAALGVNVDDILNSGKAAITAKILAVPVVTTPPVDTTDYTVFPGASKFVLGQSNGYVLQLSTWLSQRGATLTPTSTFTAVVQAAMAAFQAAQGYSGSDADGIPGATTWGYLKAGTGNNIPSGGTTTPPASGGWVNSVAINDKTGVAFTRYTSGGTVASWIAAACAARGITSSAAVANWTKGYQTAIARESSGDANACNTNDSNNKTPAGYSKVADYGTGYGNPSGNLNGQLVNYQCSRGVAQCIPQTFAANHCPGTSNVIYDPVANIAASMGYVRAQYGVAADGSNLASKVQQFDPNRSPAGY